ncbi:hypothetical protein RSOLAG22IIIB_10150 [Rhizoctonia solani]|uniref:Uncharacterized protein n=1 Tax=Rhizoctonia solani TaxID=456999 RepID=A0A0K6G254_9AGAM|nr:hypothetical protein RSOLAG22IIIB_10150 [Rhizoctonia solani]
MHTHTQRLHSAGASGFDRPTDRRHRIEPTSFVANSDPEASKLPNEGSDSRLPPATTLVINQEYGQPSPGGSIETRASSRCRVTSRYQLTQLDWLFLQHLNTSRQIHLGARALTLLKLVRTGTGAAQLLGSGRRREL